VRITQLRNLLAVADAGSIRGAARSLNVSQPALTRSIRQLEAELHAQLLDRSGRGVAPTSSGKALLARARTIYSELERAREEQAQLAGASAGAVAFGVVPQAAIHIVPAALAQFRSEHPNTDVRIVDGLAYVLLPQLREGSLDFVIGSRPQGPFDGRLRFQPLFTNQIVVGARRGHPLRKVRSLRELVEAQWVIYMPPGWTGAMIPDIFVKNALEPPRSVVRCESYVAFLTILAGTDLVAPLSRRLFEQPIARSFFEAFDVKERLPEFSIGLFQRADSPPTPVVANMLTAVRVAARRLAFKAD
jgi:LysR family transcriptional regulator of abg operon